MGRDQLEPTGERTLPGIRAENYWFQRHVAAYRFAARLARGSVLDAGAGEGYGAALLARTSRVVGVEIDSGTIARAARRYPTVRFARGDLERLPFRARSLDAIVALQVVEHLADPESFVALAHRSLRPDGLLVVTTPNRATFPAGLNPWHTREYEGGELRALLAGSFGDVELLGIAHGPLLARLDAVLGEPVQHRLVGSRWDDLPRWLRAALRSVRSRAFRVTDDASGALDLLAVCRRDGR